MSLFKTPEERELWIRLNAERQIEWEKGLTYFNEEMQTNKPTRQALHPRTMKDAMDVSRNQCAYDEACGSLRFTSEELIILGINELNAIKHENHLEWCKRFH
ncbi:MAG: hypothetical protein V4665_01175 [Patescibacteria group bacterium]